MTTAIFKNCIIRILTNYPVVSSLIVCFFSTIAIFSKIVQVMILMIVTTTDVPITIPCSIDLV